MSRTEILEQINSIELPENVKLFIVIEEEKPEEEIEIELNGKISQYGFYTLLENILEKNPEAKQEIRKTVLEDFVKEQKATYEPLVNMVSDVLSNAFNKPEVENKQETPVNQMDLFDGVHND